MYRPNFRLLQSVLAVSALACSAQGFASEAAWLQIMPAAPYVIQHDTLEVERGTPVVLHVRGMNTSGTAMTLEAPVASDPERRNEMTWTPLSGSPQHPEAELYWTPTASASDITLTFIGSVADKTGKTTGSARQVLTVLVKNSSLASELPPAFDTSRIREHYACQAGKAVAITLQASAASTDSRVDFMVDTSPVIASKVILGKLEHPSSQVWRRKLNFIPDATHADSTGGYQVQVTAIDYTLPQQPQTTTTFRLCGTAKP